MMECDSLYHIDTRQKLKGDEFEFQFQGKYDRINNSPYVMIKGGKDHTELVREGLAVEEGF